MQNNRKTFRAIFRSTYAQVFLCYSLASCVFYFVLMFIYRRPIVPDIFLALNLVVPAVLWFFIGIAMNRWTQKAGIKPVPAFKIVLASAVLVLIYQVLTAFVISFSGTVIPIAGSWLTFRVFPAFLEADSILHFVPILPAVTGLVTLPILLLIITFIYRILCFIGQVNTRMVAVFTSLFVVTIISRELAFVLYGGSFNFMSVRNFIDLGIGDFYNYAFYFVFLQLLLFGFDKAQETLSEADFSSKEFLRAFLKYEAGNIREVTSRLKKVLR